MKAVNILILDNQPIVRNAIVSIINKTIMPSGIIQSNSIKKAVSIVREKDIDMIILDVELLDGNGLDFIQYIRRSGYKGTVLFISSGNHPLYNYTAKNIGANGYILKTEEESLISDAIIATHRGYFVFKQCLSDVNGFPNLSERESVVFSYLSQGYSNKKISELLSLSSKTISTYKTRILEKFNASSIIEIMEMQRVT